MALTPRRTPYRSSSNMSDKYTMVAAAAAPSAIGPYWYATSLLVPPSLTRSSQAANPSSAHSPCRPFSELANQALARVSSQATKTDTLIFLSGCIPLVPETMKVVEGGVEAQTVSCSSG
jgi:enamine deaminase RidA (YjgF/YER057c/UK114 family)